MNSNQEELMANAFYKNIEVEDQLPNASGIEESEEETITLDFNSMTAYTQPEEKVVIPEALSTVSKDAFVKEWNELMKNQPPKVVPLPELEPQVITNEPKVEFIPPVRTYKDDIQDLIVNKLASQAIASLIEQQAKLDIEIDNAIDGKKLGTLQGILSDELGEVIDKRKRELKQCFGIGGRIDFDKIPKWARSYVEDYITNILASVCILGDA